MEYFVIGAIAAVIVLAIVMVYAASKFGGHFRKMIAAVKRRAGIPLSADG